MHVSGIVNKHYFIFLEVEGGGDSGDSISGSDGSVSAAVGVITGSLCGLYGNT